MSETPDEYTAGFRDALETAIEIVRGVSKERALVFLSEALEDLDNE